MLSLPKSILVSACLHVGLLCVFLLTSRPSGARILLQPHYQVRLVEPSEIASLGAKKEAPAPKPSPPPPPPPPPAPAPPPPPKPPVEKPPPPPKPPAEKVVHVPDKKEAVKPEIKEPERTPPSVTSERLEEVPPAAPAPRPERVLEDVLARLRKEAESRAPAEAGRPSGTATAPSSGWEARQQEVRYHEYHQQVERLVRNNWIPPKGLEYARENVMTVVSLTLLPDGRVLESYIEASSGDLLFDQSVMRAILKSTPLPPPPIGLRQDRYELGLRFHSLPHTR